MIRRPPRSNRTTTPFPYPRFFHSVHPRHPAAGCHYLGGTYAGTNTFSGVISGTGNLINTGSSVWELSGANTREGTITVDGGTLRAGSATAFGTITGIERKSTRLNYSH